MYESRADAKRAGGRTYSTGKPCSRGHISERYTSTGQCIECQRSWVCAYRAERPDVAAKSKAAYRAAHPGRVRESAAAHYVKNAEALRAAARERYAADPERYKAEQAARRASDPVLFAEIRAKSYRKNIDTRQRNAKAWRDENKDTVSASNAGWRKRNPEANRAKAANYRARKVGSDGKHGAADIAAAMLAQGGLCVYCRSSLASGFHVDHVIPLVAGGANDATNIQLTCETCNCQKGRKSHAEYLAFREKHRLD